MWQPSDGDCEVNFGPLRPLGVFGHNLPTRLTSLIGRESDTAAVLVALGDSRLVTLIGTGGVGKSRLALQVAAESVDHFDGGVWWVELATVSDPSSLPGAVLDAIGLPAQPGRRPVRVVADHVGDRPMLLVLDNCEHVIASSASLAAGGGKRLGVDRECVEGEPAADRGVWSPRCDRARRDEPGTRPSRRPSRRAPRPVRARRRAAATSSASGSRPTCSLTARPSSPTAATGKRTGQQVASVPTQIVRAERGWYRDRLRSHRIAAAEARDPDQHHADRQGQCSRSRSGVCRRAGRRECSGDTARARDGRWPRRLRARRARGRHIDGGGRRFAGSRGRRGGRGRGGRHRWRHHVDVSAGQVERNLVIGGRNVAFSAAEPSWAPVAVKVIAPVCPPAAGGTKSQVTDEGVLLQLVS